MARVLVVDDEEPLRRLVRQVVERLGHQVDEAVDGVEGLALYQRSPHELVVTDILMPRMGGLRFVTELRAFNPSQPIIAISGAGEKGKLDFLAAVRTFDNVRTLQKPFRPQELMDMIAELLAPEGSDTLQE